MTSSFPYVAVWLFAVSVIFLAIIVVFRIRHYLAKSNTIEWRTNLGLAYLVIHKAQVNECQTNDMGYTERIPPPLDTGLPPSYEEATESIG